MTDTSGLTSGKQFATYDPDSSSWKMWPATGLWGSIEFSETWPKTGYMSDGQAFELPTSAPPTTESGFSSSRPPTVFSTPDTMPDAPNSGSNMRSRPAGLGNQVKTLPTPVAHPSGNSPENHLRKKPGREVVTDLAILVENDLLKSGGKVLPTPRTTDATNSMTAPSAMKHVADGFGTLPEVIGAKLLPTPTSSDWKRDASAPSDMTRKSPSLTVVEKHFPTPTASDATGGGQHPSKRAGHTRQLIDTVLGLTSDPTPPLFDVGND